MSSPWPAPTTAKETNPAPPTALALAGLRSQVLPGAPWSTAPVDLAPMAYPMDTERLTLSPLLAEDAPWLAELLTARGHGRVSAETAREHVRAAARTLATTGIGALALRPTNGSPPAGYVALIVTTRSSIEVPQLVCEVAPAARRRGYATEAATALLEAAWGTGRTQVCARVPASNTAALAVAAHLGFLHPSPGFLAHPAAATEPGVHWLTQHRPPNQPHGRGVRRAPRPSAS